MSFQDKLVQIGVHEQEISKHFGSSATYDGDVVFPFPLFLIGFFNRSGSTLLGHYLRNTPYFGGFHEHLNFGDVTSYSRENGILSFPDFLRHKQEHHPAAKPVFGYKASAEQMMMLQRFGIHRMYKGGIRIIHITRDDVIGQAISYQIAMQTKQWTSDAKSEIPESELKYDPKQLTSIIDSIRESEAAITVFSETFGHARLQVTYEKLIANPERMLGRIAVFARQRGAKWPAVASGIERQASDTNARFRKNYLEHVAELTRG